MALKFQYEKGRKVCDIDGIKVGGQPREHAPLLLGSMFQKGDKLVESRRKRKFDHQGARERIREMEPEEARGRSDPAGQSGPVQRFGDRFARGDRRGR